MTPETASLANKLCPTCGTRVSDDATRCRVCGAELGAAGAPAKAAKAVQGSRMPVLTLSLPAAIGLLALFLTIGAVMVFFAVRQAPQIAIEMTQTPTSTLTLTPTNTATSPPPTSTGTPLPSPTPITYQIQAGDTCIKIALDFGVNVQSIIQLNKLSQECFLNPGTSLMIPQPTPTATPPPTSTLNPQQSTEEACTKETYVVQENDTPSSIAFNYNVPWQSIKEYNGLPRDTVLLGQTLIIPLCQRPTPEGPTPTMTSPPPYAAPNLLLPTNGAYFTLADDAITLQWATVGTLRENESYLVTIEDLTGSTGRRLTQAVSDTKFIVPASFRPADRNPHILSWQVQAVRQIGTDKEGNPLWESAGAASPSRYFTWSGAGPATTPTP